jgi:hypothetical protein
MKNFAILCSLLFLTAMRPAHPLKMCVCHVKHQPETGRLHLTFRFFRDDLEWALEKQTGRALDLTQITSDNNRLLSDFVKKQFDLTINRKHLTLRHTASSIDDLVLVVEFDADGFAPASTYEVDLSNSILLDVFPDQSDMVRFDFFGSGNLETMRFEREERKLFREVRG